MLRGSTCSRPLVSRRSGTWTVVQGNAGGHRGHRGCGCGGRGGCGGHLARHNGLRRPRPRPGGGTVRVGRRSRACRRRRSQDGGITGCGGGFGSPLGVGGGPRWPAGGGAPAVGDAHRSAVPGTADTRRFPSAGITVPHISSRGTMTRIQPAFASALWQETRFHGPLSLFRHRSVRGRPRAGSPLLFRRDRGSPREARRLRREGLERVVSGDPLPTSARSPPHQRALAAPGCGGLPPVRGRRVRSIREGARRPVPGGRCGGWRGGRVGPGRGRAELSVGSVEPG